MNRWWRSYLRPGRNGWGSRYGWTHFCTRNCRPGHPRSHGPYFRACRPCNRRPGDDWPSGGLGGNCRCGWRRGDYDPRLLPGLGNDSPWRRWWRRSNTLTWLHTQVWTNLSWRTLTRRSLARGSLGNLGLGRGCSGGGDSRRCSRPGSGRRHAHGGTLSSGGHRGGGGDWMSRNRRSRGLGLNRCRHGRPLSRGRSFIFTLLNCLEHIARLGDARPVDLLFRLAGVYPSRPSAVFAATLKVLAHPFCFIFFERAGMRLLLGHADVRQGVKNRSALHFQLAR